MMRLGVKYTNMGSQNRTLVCYCIEDMVNMEKQILPINEWIKKLEELRDLTDGEAYVRIREIEFEL